MKPNSVIVLGSVVLVAASTRVLYPAVAASGERPAIDGRTTRAAAPVTLPVAPAPARPGPADGIICDGTEIPEKEPTCYDGYVDDFNGGPFSDPPAFSPIACGDSVCGTTGNFITDGQEMRDVDWYLISLGDLTEVTWSVTADGFAHSIWIVTTSAGILDFASSDAGEPISVSRCLLPGDWALVVSTAGFTGVPCGSEYVASVECVSCPSPPVGACCFVDGSCGEQIEVTCIVGNGVWQGAGVSCAEVTCSDSCGPDSGDCFEYNGTPGCDDGSCCAAVCAIDSFCCDVYWDLLCASEAGVFCYGACCLADDTCSDEFLSDCEAAGGFLLPGTLCAGIQEYTPDDCAAAFEDISMTGIIAPFASGLDDSGDIVPLGFTFAFYGYPNDEVGISSNGYLTFGNSLSDWTNDPCPSPLSPNDLIAPHWEDLFPALGGGMVQYETRGTAGVDLRFIAQWTNVAVIGGSGNITFQAILFEDGSIRFNYMDPAPLATGPPGAPTIGIENRTGQEGVCLPGDTDTCVVISAGGFGNPVICLEIGACCFSAGTCDETDALECATAGGDFAGEGTNCTADGDSDGAPDACDGCAGDPGKIHPGACGCDVPDTDSDGDGTPDCNDGCPADPGKTAPGICGCGVSDDDDDGDGLADACEDPCPGDPENLCVPGACCFADGSCEKGTIDDCVRAGGDFIGGACISTPCPCAADLDGTDDIGFSDLLVLLSGWGPCASPGGCPADLDGSGDVGFGDILRLLGFWGPCG